MEMKAETAEGERGKLFVTTSVPFDPPREGKITVNEINHFAATCSRCTPSVGEGRK
jgi:hypothetical protein